MTVREFDAVTLGEVIYSIYNQDHTFVSSFVRDVLQEPEYYRRNLVKFDKYENARIEYVRAMSGSIIVNAVIE